MSLLEINQRLKAILDRCLDDTLREAMAYSVFAGGKRVRPLLLLAVCEAASGSCGEEILDYACAVEMIHTYSLIHDDLPAMDNDDFRRGKPSCHKKFGEAAAILAGDALLSHAVELMADTCRHFRKKRYTEAMWHIVNAAGANGMVAGQAMDMAWENKKAGPDVLLRIHSHKTSALLKACFTAGAVLGGGSKAFINKMEQLGALFGLAFQIQDDIFDLTATAEQLGKPIKSDEKNQKNTYVTVFGMEKAQADYKDLSKKIIAKLQALPQKSDRLKDLIHKMIERVN